MTPETGAVVFLTASVTTGVLVIVGAMVTWYRLLGKQTTLALWMALIVQVTINHLLGLTIPHPGWPWLEPLAPALTVVQVTLLLSILAVLVAGGVCPGGICNED